MAEDWAINVRKYAPQADPDVIAGIIRHCGIALHSRDASLVSFGDTAETDRVRESFLKKKLGLMESNEQLDTSIAAVGAKMKEEHFRHRVTVYYLLADHYGKLDAFRKSSAHAAGSHAAESHAAPSHANGTRTAEPAAPAAAYKAPSPPASEPRAAPHAVETRAAEASAPASLYTAPSESRSAAEARSADSSATYRAPGNIADAAKSNIADTAKSGAAGIGNFGAAGLAAGAAGLGAGGAAIKGAFDGGSGAGSGAAQSFVSRSTVDEPTRSGGGMRWLLWLILAIAIVLLVAYLMGYRF